MPDRVSLYHGDCIDVMRTLPDASVDAVITDPPYGLSFMGRKWDVSVPGIEYWAECLRLLKPGGHLLAFGGTRTYHRLVVAIEDGGFEIRDMLAWLYGSGFPKSHDVSKAIDKAAGAERERYDRPAFGGTFSDDAGTTYGTAIANEPATEAAKQWSGFGTALKPAIETICLARKPLIGTVAQNVLTHGCGVLNIDACRVGAEPRENGVAGEAGKWPRMRKCNQVDAGDGKTPDGRDLANLIEYADKAKDRRLIAVTGRWPANLIHDGSDEVKAIFPETAGNKAGVMRVAGVPSVAKGKEYPREWVRETDDNGGNASRYFYCAKASQADRDGSKHPTVKPTTLMRYLCRLITPPGGIILDPFMGSGSTGKAAIAEGFRFIGVERDTESFADAERRINAARPNDLFVMAD